MSTKRLSPEETLWRLENATLIEYDHGGGRLYFTEPDHGRDLIADFYGEGHYRDIIMSLILAAAGKRPDTRALEDVIAERHRQQSDEGFAIEHDDSHDAGELSKAASCYALCAGVGIASGVGSESHYKFVQEYSRAGVPRPPWPWTDEWWKPKSPRRDLVRAAALLLAEIERLDRAVAHKEGA